MTLKKMGLWGILSLASCGAYSQQIDITGFTELMVCQSACVDQMDECSVKLEPKCKNTKDKSACYELCDKTYSSCLGECAKIAPDFSSLPKAQ